MNDIDLPMMNYSTVPHIVANCYCYCSLYGVQSVGVHVYDVNTDCMLWAGQLTKDTLINDWLWEEYN